MASGRSCARIDTFLKLLIYPIPRSDCVTYLYVFPPAMGERKMHPVMTPLPSHERCVKRIVRGFTLVELMITVAIAAILAAVAAPSFRDFVYESRLRSKAGELVSDLNFARLEAVKRNARVLVCAKTAAGNACSATTDWQNGWVVCYDADSDDVCDQTASTDPNPLKAVSLPDRALRLTSTTAVIRFNPVGTSNGSAALTLSGAWTDSTTRTANVAGTGYITSRKN